MREKKKEEKADLTSTMLSVPLKTTTKIDLIQPLEKFITKSFSKEQLVQHEEALKHLQQQRENVRSSADNSEHTRDVFCRYYALLEAVEKRFPINEENVRAGGRRSKESLTLGGGNID